MTFALRDAQPTVMHVDTEVIRAAVGLEELFILPMVVSENNSSCIPSSYVASVDFNALISVLRQSRRVMPSLQPVLPPGHPESLHSSRMI